MENTLSFLWIFDHSEHRTVRYGSYLPNIYYTTFYPVCKAFYRYSVDDIAYLRFYLSNNNISDENLTKVMNAFVLRKFN